jgi:hypothetical protein
MPGRGGRVTFPDTVTVTLAPVLQPGLPSRPHASHRQAHSLLAASCASHSEPRSHPCLPQRRNLPEPDRHGSRLIFRHGSPLCPADLAAVAAARAGVVVVAGDRSVSHDEADAQSVRWGGLGRRLGMGWGGGWGWGGVSVAVEPLRRGWGACARTAPQPTSSAQHPMAGPRGVVSLCVSARVRVCVRVCVRVHVRVRVRFQPFAARPSCWTSWTVPPRRQSWSSSSRPTPPPCCPTAPRAARWRCPRRSSAAGAWPRCCRAPWWPRWRSWWGGGRGEGLGQERARCCPREPSGLAPLTTEPSAPPPQVLSYDSPTSCLYVQVRPQGAG